MIIVTGAAGFIGSCLIAKLNQENFNAVVAVDMFDSAEKRKNLSGKKLSQQVNRDDFFPWLEREYEKVEFIFHLGARTDTTESDPEIFERLNLNYSKKIWEKCSDYQIPLIYASSAATYGAGEYGYDDKEASVGKLKPLNAYGKSKNEFDKWAIEQKESPFFWAGLKFFNVYGPNEYHKGRMASVVWHAYQQISETGKMKLFKSHRPEFEDGEQARDFIYVKDVIDVCCFLMHHRKNSGLYNLGSGKARTFLDLTYATFEAMNLPPRIEFIDTPQDIRENYQYYTKAEIQKLKSIGYIRDFFTLEEGIREYVKSYLLPGRYL